MSSLLLLWWLFFFFFLLFFCENVLHEEFYNDERFHPIIFHLKQTHSITYMPIYNKSKLFCVCCGVAWLGCAAVGLAVWLLFRLVLDDDDDAAFRDTKDISRSGGRMGRKENEKINSFLLLNLFNFIFFYISKIISCLVLTWLLTSFFLVYEQSSVFLLNSRIREDIKSRRR